MRLGCSWSLTIPAEQFHFSHGDESSYYSRFWWNPILFLSQIADNQLILLFPNSTFLN